MLVCTVNANSFKIQVVGRNLLVTPSPFPLFLNNRLLLASLMRDSTLFSAIVGKSQNLSDVRSEACAVDWFSYYLGYAPVR